MTDITIQQVDGQSRAGRKPKGVTTRRVTAANGEKVTIRAIDANSSSFGQDLLYVFSKNVAAARQENKRLLGSLSGADKKS